MVTAAFVTMIHRLSDDADSARSENTADEGCATTPVDLSPMTNGCHVVDANTVQSMPRSESESAAGCLVAALYVFLLVFGVVIGISMLITMPFTFIPGFLLAVWLFNRNNK